MFRVRKYLFRTSTFTVTPRVITVRLLATAVAVVGGTVPV